ncbi:MAG TPA: hypothetical protein VFN78_03525 [Ktedonobacterales bacterium]|nr:hypothetical protein [Ktedonobacterales bacterium]
MISLQEALIPLIAMVIPVAILIGQRLRGDPLISLSAGALAGFVIYLALTWASLWVSDTQYSESLLQGLSTIGGAVLLLSAFAMSFTDALRMRRRGWAVALCVAVYATFFALIGVFSAPLRSCAYFPQGAPTCTSPDVTRFLLLAAINLVGPCAMLTYALRAQGRAEPASTLPKGLTISRLDATEH